MNPIGERLVFFDLESSGRPDSGLIIQIGAVAVDRRLREKETFEVKIHQSTSRTDVRPVHRQFKHSVWRHCAVEPRTAAEAFSRFLRRHSTVDVCPCRGRPYQVAQLAAHNSSFDGPLLQHWFERLDIYLPASYRVLCTMQRAIWLFHEDRALTPPVDFKLGTLCQYFGVPFCADAAHDALADVRATVALYRRMMHESGPHAQLSAVA